NLFRRQIDPEKWRVSPEAITLAQYELNLDLIARRVAVALPAQKFCSRFSSLRTAEQIPPHQTDVVAGPAELKTCYSNTAGTWYLSFCVCTRFDYYRDRKFATLRLKRRQTA